MKFTYASGKVDSGTGEFASITRSGFAGNLSINISGNFNAIIKRNTAGLVIYDSNGRAGIIKRNLNVVIGNEEYFVKLNELGSIVSKKSSETAIRDSNASVLTIRRENNDVVAEINDRKYTLLAMIYLALTGYFEKSIPKMPSPFSRRNDVISNVMIVAAILVFIFLNTKYIGGIYGGLALTVLILIGAFILRRIPPRMKENPE